MPSTTICNFDPKELLEVASFFSHEVGTALFYSGGHEGKSTLFLFPKKWIQVFPETPWEQLIEETAQGQWQGFLSFEMGAFAEPKKKIPYRKAKIPLAYFQQTSVVIEVEHASRKAVITAEDPLFLKEAFWKSLPRHAPKRSKLFLKKPMQEMQAYTKKIQRVKESILEGDVYQVNISHALTLQGEADPYDLFYKMAQENPAPFSCFFRIEGATFVCTSPELLLKREGVHLETRPIKGTAPRGMSEEEDQAMLAYLQASEKERSELLMITDLMRSDLGRIALPCTVKVEELFRQEAYANVFHTLSVITAKSKALFPLQALRPLFPGGSVTGCPKWSALEVIHELEEEARGIYTGSLGMIRENGDFDFNIAIRTLVCYEDSFVLHLGGGIVLDADPEREYEETLHKGASFFKVMGM